MIPNIPAVPYMNLVRQYAQARGLLFFTIKDIGIARRLYEQHAATLN